MAKKQNFDYFEAFEQQSELAVQEAQLLVKAFENFSNFDDFKTIAINAHDIEHQADGINHDIFNNVSVEFITPIEREDITSLSGNLDSVLDNIEDVFRCIYMYDVNEINDAAKKFSHIIEDSCVALNNVMKQFKNYKKAKNIKEFIVKVNDFEEQGDSLYFECMHEMYANKETDPAYLIAWSAIFAKLEKCCDSCEHVADLVGTVLLKNS